ncbi:MAG TPA: D-alanyl-D-alanine carboxypeptidase family protein [Haloplasmataceae bacterium]
MKKGFFLIIFSVFLLSFSFTTYGEPSVNVSAECAVLIERQTQRILYSKAAHKQRPVASISKIMTAIIAIENAHLNDYVTISKEATKQVGSSLYLPEGTQIKLRDLLYGLMLRSGNDAAYAIAEHVFGNVSTFVHYMNEKAKELGMFNSTFENPSGLDEESVNISTAYDMALLTKYAMDNPLFREINNTSRHKAETKDGMVYLWYNKHRLINHYDYIIGGKTGYTKLAKRTLVSVGKKDNLELIVVTLNSSDDWNDHLRLFDYGFKEYEMVTLLEKGIFESKELDKIFYVDDKIVYPVKDEELNQFKFVIDVDDLNRKTYLLLVNDKRVMLKKEIYLYDTTHSVLNDSFTIKDLWKGIILFIRELFW